MAVFDWISDAQWFQAFVIAVLLAAGIAVWRARVGMPPPARDANFKPSDPGKPPDMRVGMSPRARCDSGAADDDASLTADDDALLAALLRDHGHHAAAPARTMRRRAAEDAAGARYRGDATRAAMKQADVERFNRLDGARCDRGKVAGMRRTDEDARRRDAADRDRVPFHHELSGFPRHPRRGGYAGVEDSVEPDRWRGVEDADYPYPGHWWRGRRQGRGRTRSRSTFEPAPSARRRYSVAEWRASVRGRHDREATKTAKVCAGPAEAAERRENREAAAGALILLVLLVGAVAVFGLERLAWLALGAVGVFFVVVVTVVAALLAVVRSLFR